jgi:hypothetical protein
LRKLEHIYRRGMMECQGTNSYPFLVPLQKIGQFYKISEKLHNKIILVSKFGLKWHLKGRRITSKYRKIIFAMEPKVGAMNVTKQKNA